MLDDYTPPPRRPAPPELTSRIRAELAAGNGRGRLQLVLPIAAGTALVLAAAGAVGAHRLASHESVVVAPAVSPSAHITPSANPTPTHTPKPAVPRSMTASEIAADKDSCLTRDVLSETTMKKGKLRVAHAMVERPVGNGAKLPATRWLVLTDDDWSIVCRNGAFEMYSDHASSDNIMINDRAAAWQDPVAGEGSGRSCRTRTTSWVETDVMLRVDPERVAKARITITAGGKRLIAPATVPVHKKWIYAPIKIVGSAASKPLGVTVEALGRTGKPQPIQPYVPSSTATVTGLRLDVDHCK